MTQGTGPVPRTRLPHADDTGPLATSDLELTALPDRVRAPAGCVGVRFLLRLHGEPVGRWTRTSMPREGLDPRREIASTIARGDLDDVIGTLVRRAVESGIDDVPMLWRSAPLRHPPTTTLSIAICTRERPAGVAQVLASLRASACDPADAGRVEVLVVDNAPRSDATRLVVAREPWARYVVEERPGLDHARNRALREATGEVVAFVDDDVQVDEAWCTTLRALFEHNPELTLLTGLVEPASLDTPAERWFEAYGGFGRGYAPRWTVAAGATRRPIAFEHANTGRYGTGANLAMRRDAALRLGGFDPALDAGTATAGGGDLEMMFRTLKGEGVVGYSNAVAVRHAHRRTWEELLVQIESWGSGMAAHLTRTARANPDERMQVAALRTWLYATWFAKRLATSYVRTPFPRALIRRELLGSFRGGALYAAAARPYAAPPPVAPLHASGPASIVQGRVTCGDLGGTRRLPAGTRMALHVHIGGRDLGTVIVDTVGGMIGETRLRDAIAGHWRHRVLRDGGDLPALRRRIAECV